ncbi:MAG: hypothetical protein EOP67_23325, partial [Sphingomonas sp.]
MSIVDTVKETAQGLVQGAMSKLVPLAPDSWVPGGVPDPLIRQQHGLIGTSVSRLDGPLKVRGAAPFAAEFPLEGMVYAALAYATIPRGRIAAVDTAAAEAAPGVVVVMTHLNAPRMNPPAVFGSSPTAIGWPFQWTRSSCMIGRSAGPAAVGEDPNTAGVFIRGAFRCVITSTTPGAASA